MYPIQIPFSNPSVSIIHLGALERSVGVALECFASHPIAMSVPYITQDWTTITPMGLSSMDTGSFLSSLRRLNDEAEALAGRFRDLQERLKRDASQRIPTPQTQIQDSTRKTPTIPPSATDTQHRLPTSPHVGPKLTPPPGAVKRITGQYPIYSPNSGQLDEERLKEMQIRHTLRSSDPQIAATGRSRWYLSVGSRSRGNVFVNEDGRGIHIHHATNEVAVFGYGWHRSLMHYLEVSPSHSTGRSFALLSFEEVYRGDYTAHWFLELVRSLFHFHSSSGDSLDAVVNIKGKDNRGSPHEKSGPADDETFLRTTFTRLNLAEDFTVESKQLVEGTRNATLSHVNPAVPQVSCRFAVEDGQVRLYKTHYRSKNNYSKGEADLPDEIRRKFAKFVSPRPPARVP